MRYSIYLCNPFRMTYQWQTLCEELHALFTPVIEASTDFDSHRVRSTMEVPSVTSKELVIYVVPSRSDALVQPFFGVAYNAQSDGCTAWNSNGTASEVYRGSRTPRDLARLAYHEAMHNKLHRGDSLHRLGGLAAEEISAASQQLASNTRLMGRALSVAHPQWTGGFAYANDPLRGM